MIFKKCYLAFFSLLLLKSLAAEALQVELEVFRVSLDEAGVEQFEIAETAAPGDTIEYRATYVNSSERTLSGIVPEIPVPSGLIFKLPITETDAGPIPTEVLIDGSDWVVFSALTGEPPVFTQEQVSALRWAAFTLEPESSRKITFRAAVAR